MRTKADLQVARHVVRDLPLSRDLCCLLLVLIFIIMHVLVEWDELNAELQLPSALQRDRCMCV